MDHKSGDTRSHFEKNRDIQSIQDNIRRRRANMGRIFEEIRARLSVSHLEALAKDRIRMAILGGTANGGRRAEEKPSSIQAKEAPSIIKLNPAQYVQDHPVASMLGVFGLGCLLAAGLMSTVEGGKRRGISQKSTRPQDRAAGTRVGRADKGSSAGELN